MKKEFVWTDRFLKGWYKCGLEDDKLRVLENLLMVDPKIGSVIPNTNGARKIRFAFEDKGKSGSARVIYVDLEVTDRIVALDAYQKSKKEDLTEDDKKVIRKVVLGIKKDYGKKG